MATKPDTVNRIIDLIWSDMGDMGVLMRRLTPKPTPKPKQKIAPTRRHSPEVLAFIKSQQGLQSGPKLAQAVVRKFGCTVSVSTIYTIWGYCRGDR